MRQAGIEPDAATYNVVVRMYSRTHRLSEARATISEMVSFGVLPSAATFSPLFAGYASTGDKTGVCVPVHVCVRSRVHVCACVRKCVCFCARAVRVCVFAPLSETQRTEQGCSKF